MAGDAQLFRSGLLELSCGRSGAGQTAEVSDGTGNELAASDGRGTITDSSGAELLRASVGFEGRGDRGTDARLTVSDPAGAQLGEVRVEKFSYGPRASKATLSVRSSEGEVARFEPQDRKGEEVAITAGGSPIGRLRKTGKSGFIRTTTEYTLELPGGLDERARPLVLAAGIRYQALVAAAVNASQRD